MVNLGQSAEEIAGRWGSSSYLDEVDYVGNPHLTLTELAIVFRIGELLERPDIAVIVNNAAWALNQCLWAARTDAADVQRCLASVSGFFQTTAAASTSYPNGVLYMFWDIACGRGECRDEVAEVAPICGYLLSTLSYILSLNSKVCQLSALHGLNHMPSRAVSQIIRQHYEFLFDDDVRGFAGRALGGGAL